MNPSRWRLFLYRIGLAPLSELAVLHAELIKTISECKALRIENANLKRAAVERLVAEPTL